MKALLSLFSFEIKRFCWLDDLKSKVVFAMVLVILKFICKFKYAPNFINRPNHFWNEFQFFFPLNYVLRTMNFVYMHMQTLA